jgi:hypothetical protein
MENEKLENLELIPVDTSLVQAHAQRMEALAITIQTLGEILTDEQSEFPDEDTQTFRMECRKQFLSLVKLLEAEAVNA